MTIPVTIDYSLRNQALAEIVASYMKHFPNPGEFEDMIKAAAEDTAKSSLRTFIVDCRDCLKRQADEPVAVSTDAQKTEQEQNYWNLFSELNHDHMLQLAKLFGLSQETAEKIIAALTNRVAN